MKLSWAYIALAVTLIQSKEASASYPVTTNILQRTFLVLGKNGSGTAFSVSRNGRQFLVTAKHVLEGSSVEELFVSREEKNVKLDGATIKRSESADVAVIALPKPISPDLPLSLVERDVIVSQDVYFLGFPVSRSLKNGNRPVLLFTPGTKLNAGFPIPLVKKAIVSGVRFDESLKKTVYFLDGINTPGFSGGPVIASDPKTPKVFAIISGYMPLAGDVVDSPGGKATGLYEMNTGIVVAHGIEFANELIDQFMNEAKQQVPSYGSSSKE